MDKMMEAPLNLMDKMMKAYKGNIPSPTLGYLALLPAASKQNQENKREILSSINHSASSHKEFFTTQFDSFLSLPSL